jgi:glycosyltransferase involved in cell wall biosynthesis
MKIGINASFARKPNTGIGQVTLNFLRKLSNFKFLILNFQNLEFILYLEEPLSKDIKLPDNFKTVTHLPLWKRDDIIRKIWWDEYWLPKQAKEDGCDVFFSLYQCPTIMSHSIKHIMLIHDVILEFFPEYLDNFRKKYFWRISKSAILKADKILAISKHTEKDLIEKLNIPAKKISVNYIDVAENYKIEASTEASKKKLKKYLLKNNYILGGGGLDKRKNIDGLIHAYHHLLEQNKKKQFVDHFPDLVIYGKLMPQLAPLILDAEKLIKELNLTQHIKLLDYVPQPDLPALYKNALMFIYPSHYEGFGLPILEAMNQGKPVITSKTSSLPEVGKDAVLYCNPDDVEDMAMVIKNLMTNPHLHRTLSERGRERAKDFSWDRFVEKLFNIISSFKDKE